MGKQRPERPAAPPAPAPEAFAALAALRGTLPAGREQSPSGAAVPQPFAGKIVISRERKGRGGKTVTLVRGIALDGESLAALAREMRQALGTGGSVEDGVVELAGEHSARVAEWLRGRGATTLVIGN